MNKSGSVYFQDKLAGVIEQTEGEYRFTYDAEYLTQKGAQPVSLALPLRAEPYTDKTMIPFFDGLIPEGWLLTIVEKNWKIDRRDRMALILTVCQDCIGAVKVIDSREVKE
jgi:serine/threonine-protein kinase HipA